jgi:transcriptional regulator with XRE-family HTH domain
MEFKDKLRTLREKAHLSQCELAEQTGISQGAISLLESGRNNPRPITVKMLANVLHVSEQELLGRSNKNE